MMVPMNVSVRKASTKRVKYALTFMNVLTASYLVTIFCMTVPTIPIVSTLRAHTPVNARKVTKVTWNPVTPNQEHVSKVVKQSQKDALVLPAVQTL